eukprot:30830-Pelagococcus_subviridis.AAC.8
MAGAPGGGGRVRDDGDAPARGLHRARGERVRERGVRRERRRARRRRSRVERRARGRCRRARARGVRSSRRGGSERVGRCRRVRGARGRARARGGTRDRGLSDGVHRSFSVTMSTRACAAWCAARRVFRPRRRAR